MKQYLTCFYLTFGLNWLVKFAPIGYEVGYSLKTISAFLARFCDDKSGSVYFNGR